MKNLLSPILFAVICLDAQGAQLTVEINSKGEKNGNVVAGFYSEKNKENYAEKGMADITCESEGVSGAGPTVLTCTLEPGVYAAAFFHDENGNGELDSGFMGPKEPYGFSNNAFGFMGKAPPKFEDASFSIGADEGQTLMIKLK